MTSFPELAQSIQLALKALAMYTEAHPRSQKSLEDLHGILTTWLMERASLHIVATGGNLFVDGNPSESTTLHMTALARQLTERQIAGFVIQRNVTVEELAGMLQILILKPAKLEESGGVTQAMADRNLRHIMLSQTQYREVHAGDGEDTDEKTKHLPKVETPEESAARMLQEAMSAWKKGLEEAAVEATIGSPDASTPPPASLEALANIAKGLGWGNELPPPPQIETLRQALRSLTWQMTLSIAAGLESLPRTPESLRQVFQTLAPELFGTVVSGLLGEGGGWKHVQETLTDAFQESSQQTMMASALAQALLAHGLSEEQRSLFLDRLNWDRQSLDEKIRRVTEGRELWELTLQQRLDLLKTLLAQGRLEPFLRIVERIVLALQSDDPSLRESSAHTASGVAEWFAEPGFPAEAEGTLTQGLVAHFGWEPLSPIQQASAEGLHRAITALIARGEFVGAKGLLDDLAGLCSFLGEGQEWRMDALARLKARLGSPEALALVVEAVHSSDPERLHAVLVPYLEMVGESAADRLVTILGEEPDRRRRANLMDLIRALGPLAIPSLQKCLRSPVWYLIRNTLNLLADMGSADLLEDVAHCTAHQDLRVKHAAIRALWKLGGPPSAPDLTAMLPASDAGTQMEILFGLGQIRAPEAVPVLAAMLQDRDLPVKIRQKVIETLAQIGHVSALPHLMEVIQRKKRLFSSSEPMELKLAAAQAVLAIGDPAAITELGRYIIENESRGETRDALLRALELGR